MLSSGTRALNHIHLDIQPNVDIANRKFDREEIPKHMIDVILSTSNTTWVKRLIDLEIRWSDWRRLGVIW